MVPALTAGHLERSERKRIGEAIHRVVRRRRAIAQELWLVVALEAEAEAFAARRAGASLESTLAVQAAAARLQVVPRALDVNARLLDNGIPVSGKLVRPLAPGRPARSSTKCLVGEHHHRG